LKKDGTPAKPKGHRLKHPNTRDDTEKVTCPACSKVVSLHNLRYTHPKVCKAAQKEKPQVIEQPIETILQQRVTENPIANPIQVSFNFHDEVRKMITLERINKKTIMKEKYQKLLQNKL
jgi:predicted GTPase